jgi:hypothetical protein
MKENMMKEDIMSSDVQIDEIGDTKMGEAKGKMESVPFPRSAANVAKKIMRQQLFKGLPKQWKGHGDYFFEAQDDGTIKVTGGDKANSLTGGKSTIVKDKERIRKIIETARGGDILEENVSYKMEEKEEAPNTAQMIQADAQRRANVAGPEATKQMEEYKEKVSLGETDLTPDVRESSAPADSPVAARLKEARSGLMGMIENAENEQLAQAYRAALEQVEKGLRAELGE